MGALARWGKWGQSSLLILGHEQSSRGVDYVLTVRRLGRTLPASTCASERADIAVARPERVLGSRRAAKFNLKNYYEIIHATSGNHTSRLSDRALRPRSGKLCRRERSPSQAQG